MKRDHIWRRVAPRWYEWSMDVEAEWKAWLGFAIPMIVLQSAVIFACTFLPVWIAFRVFG